MGKYLIKHQDILDKLTLKQKANFTSGKNFWETYNIKELGIPSIFLSDGPHGVRRQATKADKAGLNVSLPATCFPTASALSNTFNVDLLKEIGTALGEEAKIQKVGILLGPGMNIKRNAKCGRNFEYYSEDPYLAGKLASNLILGIQDNNLSACAKHFALNNQELNRMCNDSVCDERTMREIYLQPFEMSVKEGKVKAIMSSYNKINGEYANENYHVLREILRDDWGFEGVVVSDWGGDDDRIKALLASSDLEMPGTKGDSVIDVVNSVNNGELPLKVLDESVDRILDLVLEEKESEKKEFDVEAHHNIARKAAVESIVLLKNDSILPLKENTKVAIIGDFGKKPRYQGAGSSQVNPTKLDLPLEVIKDYSLNFVGYERGYKRFGGTSKGLIKSALELARKAEVVLLYIGLDERSEAEGQDRANLKLPESHIQLFKELLSVNKNIVVINSSGSVVELKEFKNAKALLNNFLGGQAGARALLDVLVGKENPSGRLSETYPIDYEACSVKDYPSPLKAIYKEGLYVGYRYYDTNNISVLYPFGYGLSYSTFTYSNLKVDEVSVSLTLENTSEVDGYEVVQLYVGKSKSNVYRPKKELKGFIKVFIKSHQKVRVVIPFDDYTFRYFNTESNTFEVEKGVYEVYVGSNIQDIHLTGSIERDGVEVISKKDVLPTYYAGDIKDVSKEEYEVLLGHQYQEGKIDFVKKNRIVVDRNTPIAHLRYAKGWTGRAINGLLRFALGLLKLFKKNKLVVELNMGIYNTPIRSLSRASGGMFLYKQIDGLVEMFNGHFFKGCKTFRKAKKEFNKIRKPEIKLEKELIKKTEKEEKLQRLAPELEKWKSREKDNVFKKFFKWWVRFFIIHKNWWQFLKFWLVSNAVTIFQVLAKLVLDPLFASTNLATTSFQWLQIGTRANSGGTPFFIFDYPAHKIGEYLGANGTVIAGIGGGLALFLSYYVGVAIAQVINFFVQRNVTFKSKGNPWYQAMWYAIAFVGILFLSQIVLGTVGAPAYDLFTRWFGGVGKTVYDIIISGLLIPTISFWVFFPIFKIIFPEGKKE
ncbi:MAG: glycoside hydrolase family 3 C-terminal domain-containing protein [Bacillales bacterium]|jgi:beta-glucosidase|nr:glycoside hydrolase family 3 C-terminal domain-containing protein [Bacillales bacterium]